MVGSLYDADYEAEPHRVAPAQVEPHAWDSLPLELAMKKVKGNGERKLAVFSDADCPFCARLENELKSSTT